MKLKYIFIIFGSNLLLFGFMYFITYPFIDYRKWAMIYSILGLSIFLTGIFWEKK